MRLRWYTLGFAFAFAACSCGANAETFHWNWTGFYVGADAGIISSRSFNSLQATTALGSAPYLAASPAFTGPLATFNATAADTLSTRGTEVGVHAGYNWQLKPFAVGLEIDYGAFRTRATRDGSAPLCINGAPGCPAPAGVLSQLHSETNTDWLFTIRPRVGWVYSMLYGYITGGAAFTSINARTTYSDYNGSSFAGIANGFVSTSQTKAGWTMGAGLEIAIAPRWTLRAEYLRVDFSGVNGTGRITNPVTGAFNPVNLSADLKSDLVRVGVTHKFQWWFEEAPPVVPGPVVVAKD